LGRVGVTAGGTDDGELGADQLRRMVDSVTIGLALQAVDPPRPVYVNRALFGILGLDPLRPWPAETLAGIVHPDDRPDAEIAIDRIRRGEAVGTTEKRLVRPGGEVRWVRVTSTPLAEGDGVVTLMASTLEDITSLKNAQGALVENQALFDQMATAVQVGFTLRDVGAPEFLYVSPGVFAVLGWDPAGPQLTYSTIMSMVHPDDQDAVAGTAVRLEAGQSVCDELRVVRPDGQIRWIRLTGSPVTDGGGAVLRLAMTFEDVTAAKQSEISLRDSEARFRRTSNALHVGISLRQLDPPRFLYVNDTYVQIVGIDPTLLAEGQLASAFQRVHPEDRDTVLAEYWQRAGRGEQAQVELRSVRPAGEVRWLLVTSHPVQTEPGMPALAACTVEDITARKVAEAALLSARRDAEAANRAKSEFLSRMSHELRTPLNAVLGFAQLLEMDATTQAQHEAIGHILSGGRHLLDMINDLIDISRIETDQLELSLEPIAVAELISETIGLVGPVAAPAAVSIHFDREQPAVDQCVLADRRRLRQVLLNLLSNAIKYNKRGGRVEVRCSSPGEGWMALAVADTGIGIAADDMNRVFTPFDRLGQESSDIEGTGIGLGLVQQLVTMMGGRLEVESEPGNGSTFTAVLPLAETTGIDPGQPSPVIDSEAAAGPSAVLLHIEDNPINTELMSRILQQRPDWVLVDAPDGTTGLRRALALRPALIFLDVHLPDMNGFDVLRALRADPATVAIPVVVVSADASPGQVRRLRDAGARDCLSKPLNVPDVLRVVDQFGTELTGGATPHADPTHDFRDHTPRESSSATQS